MVLGVWVVGRQGTGKIDGAFNFFCVAGRGLGGGSVRGHAGCRARFRLGFLSSLMYV
jgi:hypothetical protein